MYKTFALGVHIVSIASSPWVHGFLVVNLFLSVFSLRFEVLLIVVDHAFNPSTWGVEASGSL